MQFEIWVIWCIFLILQNSKQIVFITHMIFCKIPRKLIYHELFSVETQQTAWLEWQIHFIIITVWILLNELMDQTYANFLSHLCLWCYATQYSNLPLLDMDVEGMTHMGKSWDWKEPFSLEKFLNFRSKYYFGYCTFLETTT